MCSLHRAQERGAIRTWPLVVHRHRIPGRSVELSSGGGGGTYAMAGTFYFHSCSGTAIAGANGLSCTVPTATPPAYYSDTLTITGNSGGSAYILGQVIIDNLALNGGGSIYMDLNPTTAQNVYKASLYQ